MQTVQTNLLLLSVFVALLTNATRRSVAITCMRATDCERRLPVTSRTRDCRRCRSVLWWRSRPTLLVSLPASPSLTDDHCISNHTPVLAPSFIVHQRTVRLIDRPRSAYISSVFSRCASAVLATTLCLSVCLSQASLASNWLNGPRSFFWRTRYPRFIHSGSSKNKGTSVWNLVPNTGLTKNFATTRDRRMCCQLRRTFSVINWRRSSVASLSHWMSMLCTTSIFVYNTIIVHLPGKKPTCIPPPCDSISSLNFQKCLYAIFGHFDIFTYLEKWNSGLFKNARAVEFLQNKGSNCPPKSGTGAKNAVVIWTTSSFVDNKRFVTWIIALHIIAISRYQHGHF